MQNTDPYIFDTIGKDRLPVMELQNNLGDSLTVYRKGAHVTSWKKPGFGELLFLSRSSSYASRPIRGGIPIIFPQFGGRPIGDFSKLPFHGFAREFDWELLEQSVADGIPSATLVLCSNKKTQALWPAQFEAQLRVTLGVALDLTLIVKNRGNVPFLFTGGFHPYFGISHISTANVLGLGQLSYEDAFHAFQVKKQTEKNLCFLEPVNRVYLSAPHEVTLSDSGLSHSLVIRQENFPELVVWRAAPEYAKEKDDLAENDYQHFVCIEPAACSSKIEVPAQSDWRGRMLIQCLKRIPEAT